MKVGKTYKTVDGYSIRCIAKAMGRLHVNEKQIPTYECIILDGPESSWKGKTQLYHENGRPIDPKYSREVVSL